MAAGITLALMRTKILDSFESAKEAQPKPIISQPSIADDRSTTRANPSRDLKALELPKENNLNDAKVYYNLGIIYRKQKQ